MHILAGTGATAHADLLEPTQVDALDKQSDCKGMT
jgi:hypothetical protein